MYRCLKPGGKAIIMLYYKWSAMVFGDIILGRGIWQGALWETRSIGKLISKYTEWDSQTETSVNPLTKVYSKREAGNTSGASAIRSWSCITCGAGTSVRCEGYFLWFRNRFCAIFIGVWDGTSSFRPRNNLPRMCGIAAILDYTSFPRRNELQPMVDIRRHVGPDGDGMLIDGPMAMGMRRLSIIDLAGGEQPIFNEDGTVAVVFNGEIFNLHRITPRADPKGTPVRYEQRYRNVCACTKNTVRRCCPS